MKLISRISLLSVVLMAIIVACSPKPPGMTDNVDVSSGGASVWIDTPLDQSTIPPMHTAVVAHANVPTGVSGFQFWVNGNLLITYPLTGDDHGAPFAIMTQGWLPSGEGWHVLKVDALNMLGEVAASTEIDVYVGFDDSGDDEQPPAEVQVVPSPTPTEEPVPEYSRCDLFSPEQTTLTMFDIQPGSTVLNFYISLPTALPGLEEPVEGDNDPWLYSALVGPTGIEDCTFQGYTQRLYCAAILPESAMDTVQALSVFVNLCDHPIFSHPRVSIIAPVCQEDMNQDACEATGGTYSCVRDICNCTCP
jgi:hypothetical protein